MDEKNSAQANLQGKKIVLVEDDVFLSEILIEKISHLGGKVTLVKNGGEVVQQVMSDLPDVLVLDVLLPGIDGFEVLRQLKADEKTKAVPVIILSNLSQKSEIEKGKQLGAVTYLVKAVVNLDEIANEIRNALGIKG